MELVSIIMPVRNGLPRVKRAVMSILNQDYTNFELIIQDGASTDGTLEYLRSLEDSRIKLYSEIDNVLVDAFAKALNRCMGAYVATCLADDELYPDTLSRIVKLFEKHPYLGAIIGDANISDVHGDTCTKFEGGPFNLLKYLSGEYSPYLCSSFFKMDALRFTGILNERWSKASLEFEIWVRLGMDTDIMYVPEVFSKYAHHSNHLSEIGGHDVEELETRLVIVHNHLFGSSKFFGDNNWLRDVVCLLQLCNLYQNLSARNLPEAQKILDHIVNANYLGEFNFTRDTEIPEANFDWQSSMSVEPPFATSATTKGSPVCDKFVAMQDCLVSLYRLPVNYYRNVLQRKKVMKLSNLKRRLALTLGKRRT